MRNSKILFSKFAFAFLALAGMTTFTSCDDDEEKFTNPQGEKEYNVYFNVGKYDSEEGYLEHEYAYHAYGVGQFYLDTYNVVGDTLLSSGEDVEIALEGAKKSDPYDESNQNIWRNSYSLSGGNRTFVMRSFSINPKDADDLTHYYDKSNYAKVVIKDKIMKTIEPVIIGRISSDNLEITNLITKKPLTITKDMALLGKEVAGGFVIYDIRDRVSNPHLFDAEGNFNTYGYNYDQILNAEEKIGELTADQFERTNVVTEVVAGYKVVITSPFTIAE